MIRISRPLILARNEGYEISIDGKVLTTPQHNILIIPTAELAEAIAEEWNICCIENTIRRKNIQTIGVSVMYLNYLKGETSLSYKNLPPLMRLASLAIDTLQDTIPHIIAKIIHIFKNDHLKKIFYEKTQFFKKNYYCCQLLEWFKESYDIDFTVENFQQPDIDTVTQFLQTRNRWALTILHYLGKITNSCILGIALSHRKIDPSVIFALTTLEETAHQKTSLNSYQRLIMRTNIIVAERFLELSYCWERNTEPVIVHRLFSGRSGDDILAPTYN